MGGRGHHADFQDRLRDGVQRRVAQLRRSEHGREILAYPRNGITRDPVGHDARQRLPSRVTRR